MTEIFCLEHTVPASTLPTVTLSLPWLPVLVGQIAWRHSAVLDFNMRFDPFVLALSIHRVIREVTFDSSLPRKRSVSKTTNSAITQDLCRRLEAGKYARIKQEKPHYKAYTPEWRAREPHRW
ncbi:hypothetical protein ABHI18_012200, partial [Aspergillus niger]